ncbi:hypothetical protein RIR_jg16655.t1 [Rhizophagus irregularis DAOM 181602=DAOM 197198]|nr:hypothetical protein RIR_jg16655.t1 [Rhizophagus irregularis DAOM 181602=DAOM 197198]
MVILVLNEIRYTQRGFGEGNRNESDVKILEENNPIGKKSDKRVFIENYESDEDTEAKSLVLAKISAERH